MKYEKEISRRKTFAIISHPDAGKTTLTEKFLLFGGAIQVAGAVKSNKIKKHATSDFMEIERQRGSEQDALQCSEILTLSSGYDSHDFPLIKVLSRLSFDHQHL